MKIKCGIDMVNDMRIFAKCENPEFLKKIYHPSEFDLAKENKSRLASIFAIKEATFKALKLSEPRWLDIEIFYDDNAIPRLHLSDQLLIENLGSIDLSVTHEKGITIAQVIILLKDK